MEAEFDAHVRSTVDSVMRTPEHDRPATPLPELLPDQMEDAWLDESPPAPAAPAPKVSVYIMCSASSFSLYDNQ